MGRPCADKLDKPGRRLNSGILGNKKPRGLHGVLKDFAVSRNYFFLRAVVFFAAALRVVFFLATFLVAFFLVAFLATFLVAFLAAFFLVAFFLVAFFATFLAAFLVAFLRVAFLATFFFVAFLRVVFFAVAIYVLLGWIYKVVDSVAYKIIVYWRDSYRQ